jgi:hypothetical protein
MLGMAFIYLPSGDSSGIKIKTFPLRFVIFRMLPKAPLLSSSARYNNYSVEKEGGM